ncbi:MAG: hypothetical protein IJ849_01725 [Selenomonadaceae bacterium]|nr:hypothetical protein [Selenomonadaceae bacterium]
MYRRFVVAVGLFATLQLLLVGSFNYFVDPVGLFANASQFATVVQAMRAGDIVAVHENYNERVLQKYILENMTSDYDVVVFGSSRSMMINANVMPVGKQLHNFSVSGAILEDDIALWNLYMDTHSHAPQYVIIGMDAWLLNKNNGEVRWRSSLAKEYERGMQRLGLIPKMGGSSVLLYRELLSMNYTMTSLKKLCRGEVRKSIFTRSEGMADEEPNVAFVFADGSHEYSREYRLGDTEKLAQEYIAGKIYHLEGFEAIDDDLGTALTALIADMERQGCQVIFYLPPYHPTVYDFLASTPRFANVIQSEIWLQKFAKQHNVMLLGSYNPSNMSLNEEDFLDGMHMKRTSVERYLKGRFK